MKEALIRDLLRWCERQPEVGPLPPGAEAAYVPIGVTNRVGTEQSEFRETPTGFDGRGHLHTSNVSETLTTILAVLGTSRRRTTHRVNDPPSPVSNVGTRRWMAPARGWDNLHRSERQASSRAAHGSLTTATLAEWRPPIFGNDGVAIGNTLGT